MAIDSRNKRASALGLAFALLVQLPLADGAVSTTDRQQVAGSYAGTVPLSPSLTSREVRAGALGAARPWMVQLPLADGGGINESERAQASWTYGGIDLSGIIIDGIHDIATDVLLAQEATIFGTASINPGANTVGAGGFAAGQARAAGDGFIQTISSGGMAASGGFSARHAQLFGLATISPVTIDSSVVRNLTIGEIIEESCERASVPQSAAVARSARRSIQLTLINWANKGPYTWTVNRVQYALPMGSTDFSLSRIDPRYHDALDIFIRDADGHDLQMTPMALADYQGIVDKSRTGRPDRYFVEKRAEETVIRPWPVPDRGDYTLLIDAVRLPTWPASNESAPDLPALFYDAICAQLGWRLALKFNKPAEARLSVLAQDAMDLAFANDRTRAPTRFVLWRR